MIKALFVIIINGKIKSTPASASHFKSVQDGAVCAACRRGSVIGARLFQICRDLWVLQLVGCVIASREGRVLSLVIFNAFKSCRLEAIYWFLNLTFSNHVRLFSLLLSHLHVGSLAQQLPLVFVPAHFPVIVSLGK